MTDQFCLNYSSRRKQNLELKILLEKINGRYENPSATANPYAKINATTGLPLTQYELDMRRKIEILKYDKSSNVSLTKKQAWTQIVRGSSQRRTYSQSQIIAIQNGTETETDDLCPTLSTSAGIPGAAFYLKLDPNVPLYNYLLSDTYATSNVENTITWTHTNNSDVFGNDPMLFTIFVGPAIDVNYGIFTFSAPLSLRVSGTSSATDVSGTFSVTIPTENISVSVSYGGSDIFLNTTPVITFESQINGKTGNGSFNGQIAIGQLIVSNLGLYLSSGFVYEISIHYVPINSYGNIDTFTSAIITGVKNSVSSTTNMTFTTNPVPSTGSSFSISRQ